MLSLWIEFIVLRQELSFFVNKRRARNFRLFVYVRVCSCVIVDIPRVQCILSFFGEIAPQVFNYPVCELCVSSTVSEYIYTPTNGCRRVHRICNSFPRRMFVRFDFNDNSYRTVHTEFNSIHSFRTDVNNIFLRSHSYLFRRHKYLMKGGIIIHLGN